MNKKGSKKKKKATRIYTVHIRNCKFLLGKDFQINIYEDSQIVKSLIKPFLKTKNVFNSCLGKGKTQSVASHQRKRECF